MAALTPGAIALVGSGEYTAAMRETDALLLAALGAEPAAVALLPTASAREPGKPQEWNQKGVEHFTALGALPTPLLLLSRADAVDTTLLGLLAQQRFFYFSGGDPHYLAETLRDTPAWESIVQAHAAGATVAGCSAGAMMLCDQVFDIRALRQGHEPRWLPGLGLARGIAALPHFDRMRGFIGASMLDTALAVAPVSVTVLGIDEDTALVRLQDELDARVWRVTGRQTVTVFGAGHEPVVYRAGEYITFGAT